MNKIIVRLTVFFCLSVVCVESWAQQKNISMQNIAEIRVDELSDDQIKQFVAEFKNSGYSVNQIEQVAIQRKMPAAEAQKLKQRVQKIESITGVGQGGEMQSSDRKYNDDQLQSQDKTTRMFESLEKKVFGAELFNNKNLTFEPNLKIATPLNYQLGPDDELIVDIYGYSEATHRLKVTPEGYVRIPLIGPVQVSGLTIEQARKKITSQLITIYSGISAGNTSVNITLGSIRSIKVNILGEVNLPGTYTIPSLATVFNALYASGGPNKNGSFRNIKVIRGGKVIVTVDVYEFLLKGEAKGNVRLMDQDVIKIGTYENRVELVGEVKRPAYYELIRDESLKDLIAFAGGFTDVAYTDRIKVTRNTAKEKSVADVPNEMFGIFNPKSGDVYEIGKIIDRYENRVEIRGAVFRPGIYAIESGLTLSKLIKKAEGLREDAFKSRAIIYRLKDDNSAEILNFDVNEVLSGKSDITLKREDLIEINSKLALKETYVLTIMGAVIRPGKYPYAENARVEDLIVAAGGLRENASRKKIEIARRFKTNGTIVESSSATIISYEVNEDLKNNKDFFLMPYDIVTVYSTPGYVDQKNVWIEGEVNYPGQYTISQKTDRISDLVNRCGGKSQFAFTDGAVLIRTKRLTEAEKIIREQKIAALIKQTKDTTRLQEIIDNEVGNLTSIVGINLTKILKKPGSKADLLLEEGDLVSIPSIKQTVKISGEVLYPVRIPYKGLMSYKSYVRGSGGYTQRALKSRGYIVYANGSAKATKNFLIFKVYPSVLPGSEIIIPAKEERKNLSAVEVVSMTASLTTLAVIVISLLK
jgi:protein involved in polysaccharide export with SLBB domain